MTDLCQAFFDKTIKHFVKQGHRAMAPNSHGNDRCVYRAPNGDRCAVGVHLPKKYYRALMEESGGVSSLLSSYPTLNQFIPNKRLAEDLQSAHDLQENWKDPHMMRFKLGKIAALHGLDTGVLNKLDFSAITP